MKLLTICFAVAALAGTAFAQKVQLKDLPAAVQKTVQESLKGGEIKNISKEKEKGVTQYEVESTLNGKHRDFNVDAKGALVVMEEETSLDSVPAPVKAAIMKKVGAGKLGLVETFQKPGKELLYEAAWTTKAGKKMEILLKADGVETKD